MILYQLKIFISFFLIYSVFNIEIERMVLDYDKPKITLSLSELISNSFFPEV